MDAHVGFKNGKWQNEICVKDFIAQNYVPYQGDGTFLADATPRTKKARKKMEELFLAERNKGGVLDVDVDTVSTITAFKPGYLLGDEDIIVGFQTDAPLKRAINPFGGLRMAVDSCKAYGYEVNPKILQEFKYTSTHNDGVFRAYTDEMRALRKLGVITGLPDAYGRGRIIGDYRRVALYGVDHLIAQKQKDQKELEKNRMDEKNIQLREEVWFQINALNNLKKMAESYGFDISKPARNTKEAVQWTYFAYLAAIKESNGAAMSLGRVSTFFDIYIERDLKNGTLDESGAQEIIDDFVIKLRMAKQMRTPEYNDLFAGDPTWVTESIGGMGLDGRTRVTKSSFRILHTLYNLGSSPEPNLTVLWSENLPTAFKEYCAKVSIDTSSIQYENDDLMRPISGDDYGIACCVSAMKIGEQMQFFGARCNMAKLLLIAINGGKDEVSGTPVGLQMESMGNNVLSYDAVWARYNEYIKWLAAVYVDTMNIIHRMHDKYAYENIMHALHHTQIERLMAFGIAGLSIVADSLSAIKYAKVTPVMDDKGLIVDYKVEGEYPKYGNDDDRVDSIAAELVDIFYNELCKSPTYRNAKHTLSLLTITSNVVYGKKTGATPCGRPAGQAFAPGANPYHGRDEMGAVASLNSVAKLSYASCKDGISNTFSVVPSTLGKQMDEQKENLANLIDGYFIKKGHHINVNAYNRKQLLDAHEHPENFPNLTIRVSGYAVRFAALSKKHREEVLARTFHDKM